MSSEQDQLNIFTIVPGRLSSTRSREPKLKIKVSVPLLSSGRNSYFSPSEKNFSRKSHNIRGKDKNIKHQVKDIGIEHEFTAHLINRSRAKSLDTEFVGFKALARKGHTVQEVFFVGENLDQNSLQKLIDQVILKLAL